MPSPLEAKTTVSHQPSTVNRQPSTVKSQPSTVNRQPSTVNRQPSTVNRQPSTVKRVHDTGGNMLEVFWVQMAASFVLWICAGAVMARGSVNLRVHAAALPRNSCALRSALLFLISPLCIFVPMWLVASSGGAKPDVLVPWAWIVVTLGGLFCVVCATLGLAYAVTLAMKAARDGRVTSSTPAASSKEDS